MFTEIRSEASRKRTPLPQAQAGFSNALSVAVPATFFVRPEQTPLGRTSDDSPPPKRWPRQHGS